jgi:phosphoribosylglycinamide formyltransferase-1
MVDGGRYLRPLGSPTLPPPHPPEAEINIAVLASGSGTNLQALLDTPAVLPHIAVVVSDRPEAGALERAHERGVPTSVVSWEDHPGREAFSNSLADVVEDNGAKAVVLAGFMRILSPSFVARFPDRILNIHPSLLPAFPGAHAVANALEYGVNVTGVTVHFVDEKVDHGPIVTQVPVPVESGDTVDSLHARIQVEEHEIYPRVVEALIQGRLSIEGRRVRCR